MKQNVIQLKKMSMEISVPIHQSAHQYVNQEKFHALPVRMKTVAKNQRFVSSKKEIMTEIKIALTKVWFWVFGPVLPPKYFYASYLPGY